MSDSPQVSPLDAIRNAFLRLVEVDALPALDGWALGVDCPDRYIKPNGVRELLGRRATDQSVRDGIWTEVVRQVQHESQPWTFYAVGLMMSGLRYVAQRVLNEHGGERDDVEATVLVGFVEAMRASDPSMRKLSSHLKHVAYQRARAARDVPLRPFDQDGVTSTDVLRPLPLAPPPGHPDLVLAHAVAQGVLTANEADIIVSSRLDGVDLAVIAAALKLPYLECAGRRQRAEAKLVKFLHSSGW